MNKIILIGNLTKDPELTTTNSGVSICRFTLAVQRKFQNADGEREVDFINVVVWRTQAENCHKYLKKGSKCAVVGRLQITSYETSDGSRRYATDVVAEEIEFLSTNKNSEDKSKDQIQPELEPIDDDSLPF